MPAGTQTRTPDTPQIRLPWWAVALPAVAFVALFILLATPASADARNTGGGLSASHAIELVRHSVGQWLP